MSASAKTTILRAILPDDRSVKTASSYGHPESTETKTIPLSSGKMTTMEIVGRIKELSKVKEEILQSVRQLAVPRVARETRSSWLSFEVELESARLELATTRTDYQGLQEKMENLQRKIDDCKKRTGTLTDLSQTGFSWQQLESESDDFQRVVGRIPSKKLPSAQKAIQAQFKDQAILAVGAKQHDAVYVLMAAPSDKISQLVQLLLLNDFSAIDIPKTPSLDFQSEMRAEDEKTRALANDLETLKPQLEALRKTTGESLNRRLDEINDAILLLKAILKLGEGTQALGLFTQLERPLPAETLNSLARLGVVELESFS